MTRAADPDRLRNEQYHDAQKLDDRIALHAQFSVNPHGWPSWLFEQLDFAADAEILELGCGPAVLWVANRERIPAGWCVRLSDFSPGMIEDARSRLGPLAERFSFDVVDAVAIPHEPASFDAVIANHMLYHVADREHALAEIARVLRPTGRLVASTLSSDTMDEIWQLIRDETSRRDFFRERPSTPFCLENAEAQLAPYFGHVEVRRYVDGLRVTHPGPVLRYLRSMILDEPLRDDELAAVEARLVAEIAEQGVFEVSKDAGVLLAMEPRGAPRAASQ